MPISNKNDNGDLQTALKNAVDLLAHDPGLAQEQAQEILKVYPDTPKAKRILASAFACKKCPKKGWMY